MKPSIKNQSVENQESIIKIIAGILNKIPEQYLTGISMIIILDSNDSRFCVSSVSRNDPSETEIHIDASCYKNIQNSFLDVLALNINFLAIVGDHINNYQNNEHLINAFPRGKINRRWMYFGKWLPIAFIAYILLWPIKKYKKLNRAIYNRALKEIKNEEKPS